MQSLAAVTLAILVLPALGALVLGAGAFRLPRRSVQLIGPGVVWLAFICTLILFWDNLAQARAHDFTYWTWIRSGDFELPANLLVDRLSIYMCLVITGVGGLIVTYAVGYMEHETDGSYARFFCYMDLFILSMLVLVLAGNFVFLIIGWAGVGLSSYLLIGFYYWRHTAVVAARKAFVMNVIGDIGLILAALAIFVTYHQMTYARVFGAVGKSDSFVLELIGFLLLVGGIAKSAQLPLHTWLPDAMEGPTPVSALIHAATMVTAGVYLIARMHPIYDVAAFSHNTAAALGTVTALMAATIAIVQTDIKRVLAYSTMSQIGYMFLGVGLGAYGAGLFHLLAHAFFKALLFMSAGNIIHAMHDEQDMRKFGGLWRDMRFTSVCFLIGSLSLVGIFPLVGFFSKELVLGDAFSKPDPSGFPQVLWALGFLTALLTGFYTGRMWWIAFVRPPSPERPVEHPHEPGAAMRIPVLILTILTCIGGLLQINAGFPLGWKLVEEYLAPVVGPLGWEPRSLEYAITVTTFLLGVATFVLAYYYYIRPRFHPLSQRFPRLQRLLEHKYYFDELYDAIFVRPLDRSAEAGDRFLEQPVLEGSLEEAGVVATAGAAGLSLVENGYFRAYMLIFLGGALVGAALLLVYRFAA
ncbi:MAG: NADH-quinone oxidoreductase subunit L [Candidatus Nephthysia bennettiae]|uniref:NADH-quinone oxidoreductase subunit L n=1 Tax=Candidatus Nephthysia bennettiae TaxID=3127016 RepID=A0A934K453_9BACT|nr:NADH-quinone oxidoreductase subunit L [Candidatus Dormibacteraeota bacterium]MBJ7611319.1 NADH-quinone oxidoreductase subunit L [Candidatus Dormibacteraeota bacterium]PZR97456.1 MAG: NADH-quinone oxidoreductase subunit L [Candidatus Dormibacteraeota bacterium]